MLCYGHKSNFDYFTHYGFTLEEDEYNAVALWMPYNEAIPNHELKMKLMGHGIFKGKFAKFYENYQVRSDANKKFFAFCRFYWSDLAPEAINKAVIASFNKNIV